MTSPAGDWDDTRLEAAFTARASRVRTLPADLAASVVETLPRRTRAAADRPRALLAAAAAIMLTVGLGGLATVILTNRPQVAATPGPSHLPTGPIAVTAQELGLTPIGVAEALATYQATPDDREVLVSGYLSNDPGPITDGGPTITCDVPDRDSGPLLSPQCSPLVMAEPESIVTRTLTSATVHRPSGPAFSPNFAYAFTPDTPEVPIIGEAAPIAITVVGHFHDRRSASCYIGEQAACQSTFVVDRIVEVDGIGVHRTPVLELGRQAAEQALARAVPGLLVVTTVRTGRGDIEDLEPSFVDPSDIPAPVDSEVIWLIQAITAPDGSSAPRSVRTFLVGEGRDVVVEMTEHGPTSLDPKTALGLPILSAAEAIAVRDGGDPGDRELAVHGWFSPARPLPCPAPPRSVNPVRLQCPFGSQWLLDSPEPLAARQSAPTSGRAGFQALLPFLDQAALTTAARPATREARLVEVVLIGHFHDRRGHGALCDVPDPAACAGFVADGIYSIDGVRAPTSTIVDLEPWEPEPRHEPAWTPADVDGLFDVALPSLEILSRVALPGHRVSQIEPALGTGGLGVIDRDVVWSVTGLDVGPGSAPIRRTFLVVDGTAEAYETAPWEVSNIGFVPFRLIDLPLASPVPASLSPDVDPFARAPHEVAGLVSRTVAMAVDRRVPGDDSEILVRGWYVAHDPAASCPNGQALDAPIRPVLPVCNEGQNWLLELPEQLWSDPSKIGIDRLPTGASINPIIPSDVPFDVPPEWQGGSPTPLAVVVLGHFTDPRVQTYAGDAYFVIDQLVWTSAAGMVTQPDAVRLTASATETPEAVLARIESELGQANLTWVSVLDPRDLAILDPDTIRRAPELAETNAVWVVRRLIDQPYDNLTRRLIDWAFTVDGGERVWGGAGSGVDLATTIDVDPPGSDTRIVEVVDYSRWVLGVRALAAADDLGWRAVGPDDAGWRLEIARGSTPHELAVRWHGYRCQTDWKLSVRRDPPLAGPWVSPSAQSIEGCEEDRISRAVVLTFDRPIDLDTVTTNDNTSGG
jgi:hypothetical protein